MGFQIRNTNAGISISFGEQDSAKLEPSLTANQTEPRRFYVYAHYTERGSPFYIGKGTGRRAWSKSRHPLWVRYVTRHLGNKFTVKILEDDLTENDAEELESEWIDQESETLVNWGNAGRKFDFDALERFHRLRNANRKLIADTRQLETTQPEDATTAYYRAIENIAAYATLKLEGGLVGQLCDEEHAEIGYSGELAALDRLTLCLVRLKRREEAQAAAEVYFTKYRADETLRLAQAIKKRVLPKVK